MITALIIYLAVTILFILFLNFYRDSIIEDSLADYINTALAYLTMPVWFPIAIWKWNWDCESNKTKSHKFILTQTIKPQ